MLQALHSITLDLGTASGILTLVSLIMKSAVELLDANQGGGIYLYDEQQNLLLLVEGAGINEKFIGMHLRPGEGVAGKVFQTRKSLVINQYEQWEGRHPFREEDIPGVVLGVPLFSEDKTIGALILLADFEDPHIYPTGCAGSGNVCCSGFSCISQHSTIRAHRARISRTDAG